MVRVVIAGATGFVAQEIIDRLIASGKHEITALTRRTDLVAALQGVETALSFIQILSDPNQMAQKNLIDAAIVAGVERVAPSEYGSRDTIDMPWWAGKENVRSYLKELKELNRLNQMEYTLFQPGLFMDYLAYPHHTAKYVQPLQTVFDVANHRAMLVDGHEDDAIWTFTCVADVAALVVAAVESEGLWPVDGGMRGERLSAREVVRVCEGVTGHPFKVDHLHLPDLRAGTLKASWSFEAIHNAVADEEAKNFLQAVPIGLLLSSTQGAWDVSDHWNRACPHLRLTSLREFLGRVFAPEEGGVEG